jgi:hypothetical protein
MEVFPDSTPLADASQRDVLVPLATNGQSLSAPLTSSPWDKPQWGRAPLLGLIQLGANEAKGQSGREVDAACP